MVAAAIYTRISDDRRGDAAGVLDGIEARLEQLARDHYGDALISRAQFLAASQTLEAQAAAARKQLARVRTHAILDGLAGVDRTTFDALGLDRQRAVVAEVVDRVVVVAAVKGHNRFDPDRLRVVWRV